MPTLEPFHFVIQTKVLGGQIMTWWEGLIAALGLPALRFALTLLEQKYPGIGPIINQVIQFLAANPTQATAIKLQEHLKTFQVPGPK